VKSGLNVPKEPRPGGRIPRRRRRTPRPLLGSVRARSGSDALLLRSMWLAQSFISAVGPSTTKPVADREAGGIGTWFCVQSYSNIEPGEGLPAFSRTLTNRSTSPLATSPVRFRDFNSR
jgi:hypothetical protein